jgi:hypothetical protein
MVPGVKLSRILNLIVVGKWKPVGGSAGVADLRIAEYVKDHPMG